MNKEMSYKIDSPEKCMRLVKRTFGEFFKDMKLDPNNIDLICSRHKDKPHHLHIHFWFAEKEPKCKYRKKQTEYRHKGKISKAILDKMHVRLNLDIMQTHEMLYVSRDEATSKERLGQNVVLRKIPFTPMARKVLPYIDFEKAKAVNLNTVSTRMKRLLPDHHPHELRHTFVSRCKESGVASEVVSIWTGHLLSGTITSTVYTHYSDEFQLHEAEKVVY